MRDCAVFACSCIAIVCSAACAVPDPGPGDTLLNMTAVQGFLDAARDGQFDQLRQSLPHGG